MSKQNELTNEQALHPTDNEQTTHTMKTRAEGEPLEPLAQRPDLVQLTEAEVDTLPSNVTK